jgi:hypothetical protein
MPALRLFVEASIGDARQSIEPDFSMRSSLQSSNQMLREGGFDIRQNRGISNDFEDVLNYGEEQKSRPSIPSTQLRSDAGSNTYN